MKPVEFKVRWSKSEGQVVGVESTSERRPAMKIRLYQPCNDGTYHTIPDNMLVSNPEHFYPAADYEALEAKLREMKNSRDLEREANKHLEAKLAALEKLLQEHQTRGNPPTKPMEDK